jgi:hypothetical protein
VRNYLLAMYWYITIFFMFCNYCICTQVGFEMIDAIAEAEGISVSSKQFKSMVGKGNLGIYIVDFHYATVQLYHVFTVLE